MRTRKKVQRLGSLRVAHGARLRTGDYFLGAQLERELGAAD
jgi:hypothetical protein